MLLVSDKYHKREFWIRQNLNYADPHFRLEKAARIVTALAQGKECDLLDVGCGPATLMRLLRNSIHYYGIDIAIHDPAPNLIQADFLETPIRFANKQFDIILAQGVFEYAGRFQSQKFVEIKELLRDGGRFIVSYVNFNHLHRHVSEVYNNIQSVEEFRRSVERVFRIDHCFPTSHHWHHHEPSRRFMKSIQMRINVNIPFISPIFAVEYFFICSVPGSTRAGSQT